MKEIKKLYFSIGEVSKRLDLAQHVLRYWETEFEQLSPKKNRAGNRVYTERDLSVISQIQHLLKEHKYTIEGAKQVLDGNSAADRDHGEALKLLSEARDLLKTMRDKL